MTDYAQQAREIIEKNIYMTVATSSPEGNPWISPVFFAYDSEYNLYWVSNKDARHSQYVRANPNVAIAIFDSSAVEGAGDGVYVEAVVEEMAEENVIEGVTKIWNRRAEREDFKILGIDKVTGDAVWRIYKAVPRTVSKLKEGEYVNGQYVDKRIEVDLL